jgi:hypothetical protein
VEYFRFNEVCDIGQNIDDGAEGDAETESAHGSRAYVISAATSSARGQSRESFVQNHRKSPSDGVFADDNILAVRKSYRH